jgi:hypothetical protein
VQYHDEPYALWRKLQARGSYDRTRFAALLENIRDWDVFAAFLIVDGCTAGKSRESLRWFLREIEGQVQTRFSEQNIL